MWWLGGYNIRIAPIDISLAVRTVPLTHKRNHDEKDANKRVQLNGIVDASFEQLEIDIPIPKAQTTQHESNRR